MLSPSFSVRVNTERQKEQQVHSCDMLQIDYISRQAKLSDDHIKYRLNFENWETILGLEILHGDYEYQVGSPSGSSLFYD